MAVTIGNRFSTQTALLNGIDSQRLFGFDGKFRSLDEKNMAMFLKVFNTIGKKTVNDPDYKYTEMRGSWLNRPAYYFDTVTGTVTNNLTSGLSAGTAGLVFEDVNFVTAAGGATAVPTTAPLKEGSVVQLVGQSSSADVPTQVASFIVKAPTTAATGRFNLVLTTNAPGFNATKATAATQSKLYVVSNAYGEGSDAGIAKYEAEVIKWASCEITKERYAISKTASKLAQAGDFSEAMKQMKYALHRHDIELNRKAIYGSFRKGSTATDPYSYPDTSITDADGNVIRTSTSLLQACKTSAAITGETRVFNVTSSSTIQTVTTQMMAQFKYGSADKWAFVGDGFMNFIQALVWGASSSEFKLFPLMDVYGIKVTKLVTSFGEINLVRDKSMTHDGFYSNTMFVVDPENVDLLVYRDTESVELPTTKDIEDMQFISEIGLCVKYPETHGFWYYS